MLKKLSFQISLSIIIIAVLAMFFGVYHIVTLQSLKIESQKFITEFNQEEILGFQNDIVRIQRIVFIFLVLTFILAVGLLLNIVFIFVYSLRTILSGIEEFKKGGYKHRIFLVSKNEFGVIASYFNEAIRSVEKAEGQLKEERDKIIQKSVELTEKVELIEKQNEELERFQRVTVGRELKMIELKKEITTLKGKSL